MSAPSKEEIAAEVDRSRRWLAKFAGKGLETADLMHGTIVALSDENERLLTDLREAVDAEDDVRRENERLRSLVEKQRALIAEQDSDHARLRAERAECIAVVEDLMGPSVARDWDRARALLAKLRGQQP